jgi:hypothetical protein
MSIAVQCSHCNGRFTAPDLAMGKTALCPKCGHEIEIMVQPHTVFQPPPIVHGPQEDIQRTTSAQRWHPHSLVIGTFVAAALAAIAVGYLMFNPEPPLESVAGADVDFPQEVLDAKPDLGKDTELAGLGFSLEQFKEDMPIGTCWKVFSDTTRDEGVVTYQLLSTDMTNVLLIVSGKSSSLSEVSMCFCWEKGQTELDAITRALLMASIFAKYSDWTVEEIAEWWGRLIRRRDGIKEDAVIQKNGQELSMTAIGVKDGVMFIAAVVADPKSTAPTLQEWLAAHPMAPPKSGKSHYHSIETAGKVANATFSFRNFRHRGRGDFIGELVNESGKTYEVATFTLSVYDAGGALIDADTIMIMHFKRKEVRSFDAYVESTPSYFSYKFDLESGL